MGYEIHCSVESVKQGMETSMPRLFDEALSKLQSSIPALVEGEMKKQLLVIPSLVEEAVKTQLRASIPELTQALTVMKEGQRITTLQVEEASIAVPAFLPFAQSLPRPITIRASPQQDESSNLYLKFAGNLPESKSLFTKEDIKDQGASLKVELHDQFGHTVDVGPESSAKIKIFVVAGDFNIEDGDEDISKHVVTPREGKPPLLKGKSEIYLINGVASVSEIAFTDNSKSMRNGKFRLGAQVIRGVSPGVSIKVALSDGFQVKEHRNTFNRKQQISLDDEVWHLVNIGKGRTRKKLEDKGIHLVKDLLHLYDNDVNELLHIFRGDKKKLNKTVEMARSCSQSALPIQSQMIPDNSQKQLVETSKQIEQRRIPPMTNLTTDEAESSYSRTLSSIMALWNTMDSFQGEPAMQPDDVTHVSPRELGPQISLFTAFENQKELPGFYGAFSGIRSQAENVFLSTSASNIHLNATGADQGVMSYQPGKDTFDLTKWGLTVDDYFNRASYIEPQYRPRRRPRYRPGWRLWRLIEVVLRVTYLFRMFAAKVSRARKRQKLN